MRGRFAVKRRDQDTENILATRRKPTGGKTTTTNGKDGLLLLVGQAGAEVAVKCDKDVNVLKVTAKLKK